jgi:hypothetical protein
VWYHRGQQVGGLEEVSPGGAGRSPYEEEEETHRLHVAMHRWRRQRGELAAQARMHYAASALGKRLATHRTLRVWSSRAGSRRAEEVQMLTSVCEWRLEALLAGKGDPLRTSRNLVSRWAHGHTKTALNGWRSFVLSAQAARSAVVMRAEPLRLARARREALLRWRYAAWSWIQAAMKRRLMQHALPAFRKLQAHAHPLKGPLGLCRRALGRYAREPLAR